MNKIILTIVICILSVQISNAQWVQLNTGMGNVNVSAISISGNNIFVGAFGPNANVYLSSNNGTSWIQTSLNQPVSSIVVRGNSIFAGIGSPNFSGVYLSTNDGTSWTQTSLNNRGVYALAANGNTIFAGTGFPNNSGVYKSTDNGTSWTQTSLNNLRVISLAVNGNNIFAGIGYPNYSGVYLSTDDGTTWTQTSLNNRIVYSLAADGNNIFAGTGDPGEGVFLSTNNGMTWTQTSLNNRNVSSLTVNAGNIYAGTNGNGVYVSNDNGTSWIQRNEGLGNGAIVNDLCILNNYIFAGTIQYSVWRRTLGELTGIETISNEVPNKFVLSQNYPNPFNPSTKIRFTLPKSSFAKLVVYDALGRELETLVNEQLKAGTYEANWMASNFSSGIYFYTLTTSEFTQTNKMILTK